MSIKKIFILILVVGLSSCTNPYTDSMERTIPVLQNYEKVLNGYQLTDIQKRAYLLECQDTIMVITEALKENKDSGWFGSSDSKSPTPVQMTNTSDKIIVTEKSDSDDTFEGKLLSTTTSIQDIMKMQKEINLFIINTKLLLENKTDSDIKVNNLILRK